MKTNRVALPKKSIRAIFDNTYQLENLLEDIEDCFANFDLHCIYWDRHKNEFNFFYDNTDEGPWLKLKCYQSFGKFTGFQLTPEEKETKFIYTENGDELISALTDFIISYFKGIKKEYSRI
jgi:hypothetical protein